LIKIILYYPILGKQNSREPITRT